MQKSLTATELLLEKYPNPSRVAASALDESLMRGLLDDQPARIEHLLGVTHLARQLSREIKLSSQESEALGLAALFHDIGRASLLRVTGFHPLDGAIFLAHRAAPDFAVEAVLFHRFARDHAVDHPAAAPFYAGLAEMDHCLTTELLSFCDLRISHEGRLVTLPERIRGILSRCRSNHSRRQRIQDEYPSCQRLHGRVLRQIAQKAPHLLPWVFLDVDHTLMEPGETLSSFSLQIIEEYRQRGGRISLATGKHPLAIQGIASRLQLGGPQVAGNGCLIFQDSIMTQLASLGSISQEIATHLQRLKIPYILYCQENLFGHPALIQEKHFKAFRELQEPRPLLCHPDRWETVFKVLTFLDGREIEQERELRAAAGDWKVEAVRTGNRFLEFVPAGSGKGAAVREVLARAEWPQFHSLAIGDSENDLSMFRVAGQCAAVGNATDEVRESADFVIRDCREDGVAKILEIILRA
jgi:Cof subfamily protein (haloacid dehalogenase superfamily)